MSSPIGLSHQQRTKSCSEALTLLRFTAVFFCLSTFAIGAAWAQESSSLAGVVHDLSGAIIQNAQVTLTSTEQGSSQALQTNKDGLYTFPFVQPGLYDLRVSAQGFKEQLGAAPWIGLGTQTVWRQNDHSRRDGSVLYKHHLRYGFE